MKDLVKSNIGQVIQVNNAGNEIDIPKPFERDIFLFKTHIAGSMYVDNIMEIVDNLKLNDRLSVFREPDNKYDERAIVIKTQDGHKVGYVPKKDNVIFSRLMDAGKLLFAEIDDIKSSDNSVYIKILVYLKD